jgi:hypothetical protein
MRLTTMRLPLFKANESQDRCIQAALAKGGSNEQCL